MIKVSINFSSYSDSNFGKKAEHIHNSMNLNAAYPTPTPTLPVLLAAITQYNTDLLAAANLGRTFVADKNKSRQQLDITLRLLALYVMQEAKGDEATLISSGYTITKQREPSYITNPGNVTLYNGISTGEMGSSVKSVSGAVSYVHQITSELPTDDTVWESNNSSASSFVFKNLIQGKQYWVRVAVVGTRGQLAYSPVASMFVQ